MADFIDMQRDLGIDHRSLSSLASKLHILRFYLDKKKENVVSSIDGVIVFVSPRYYGDPPAIGDVYICNVQSKGTVYWAEPLVKVNTAMLIGLDDRIKDEMFDYYLAFLLSGIIGIYRTWALSDGSVPIERVSEVANDLTLNGLSSLESRLD